MRRLSHKVIHSLAGVVVVTGATLAQDITQFKDGYLTFTNENPALYYRVEFKPNLTGSEQWDGDHSGWKNIQTNATTVTVPVGVFYRVVGSANPIGVGTAIAGDILAPKTVYINGVVVTGTMLYVGTQNITPGAAAQTINAGYHDGTGTVAGDVNLVADNIKTNVTIFGITGILNTNAGGNAYSAAVPKTGQKNSYGTRDDGDLEIGVAWPSPRFTDHDDGTVTDNLTGLMWTKNANLAGSKMWNEAISFCNGMNASTGTYGYTDWRLPNVRELQSLIDYGRYDPPLPPNNFEGVQSDYYWSSSTAAGDTGVAWPVSLRYGIVGYGSKTITYHVWPVRTGQ